MNRIYPIDSEYGLWSIIFNMIVVVKSLVHIEIVALGWSNIYAIYTSTKSTLVRITTQRHKRHISIKYFNKDVHKKYFLPSFDILDEN